MASSSSRWKRFAFFERKNLSLPSTVWDDVVVSSEEEEDYGASLRVAVTPYACLPSLPPSSSSKTSMDNSSTLILPSSSSMEDTDIQRSLGVQITSSLEGMVRSLTQNRGEGISHSSSASDTDILIFHGDGKIGRSKFPSYYDGYVCLAFLSSPHSSVVHCVDLTWRCFPKNNSPASDYINASANVSEDMDGWRGSFDPFTFGRIDESSMIQTTGGVVPSSLVTSTTTINAPPPISSSISVVTKIMGLAVTSSPVTRAEQESSSRATNVHATYCPFIPRTIYLACITNTPSSVGICVHKNPHWYLSSTGSTAKGSSLTPRSEVIQPMGKFDLKNRGAPNCVDIFCHSNIGDGIVAVGTDKGLVLLYTFPLNSSSSNAKGISKFEKLNIVMEIPSPFYQPTSVSASFVGFSVTNVRLVLSLTNVGSKYTTPVGTKKGNTTSSNAPPVINSSTAVPLSRRTKLFVTYLRRGQQDKSATAANIDLLSSNNQSNGVCCYDLGVLGSSISSGSSTLSAPSARFDLDSRDVASTSTCDVLPSALFSALDNFDPGTSTSPIQRVSNPASPLEEDGYLVVAREDGLNIYSSHEKLKCVLLEQGESKSFSVLPPSHTPRKFQRRLIKNSGGNNGDVPSLSNQDNGVFMETALSTHVFLVQTEGNASRDSMNIYDLTHKLVGFHTLLSPGQRCLRSVGFATPRLSSPDGSIRGGVSSCIIITSTGTLITVTEKCTAEKVALLVQKHLYSAAISLALSDMYYKAAEITRLYKQYAEYLYQKGDFQAAIDQYMFTIGSLEPSYVIYRYLDAPKLPLLTKYLEEIRSRGLSTPIQDELLRTCYLHLNDTSSAEKVTVSLSSSMTSTDSNAFIASLLQKPSQAFAALCSFEAFKTAEIISTHGPALVRSLPQEMASLVISLCEGSYRPGSFLEGSSTTNVDHDVVDASKGVRPDNKGCEQYPVELFSNAFMEYPKLLRTILAYCSKHNLRLIASLKSALLELTLEEWNHARNTGDLDLETARYAEAIAFLTDPKNGDIGDSEALVLVDLAGFTDGQTILHERLNMVQFLMERYTKNDDEKSRRQMLALSRSDPEILAMVLSRFVHTAEQEQRAASSNLSKVYDIIGEILELARNQNVLPGARIARILAGDDYGPFSDGGSSRDNAGIPLSVAIDYFGSTLESSSHEIESLKTDIGCYIKMCSSMEKELQTLKNDMLATNTDTIDDFNVDVDEMYETLLNAPHHDSNSYDTYPYFSAEDFWRELDQSRGKFDVMAKFMSCGILE